MATLFQNAITFVVAPTLSGANITSGTIPAASVVGVAGTLAADQTFAGTNTFSVAPVMSGASITSDTIPAASVVGVAGTLAASQTFAGTNTFSVAPIMSGASIASDTIPAASTVGVAATLAATQSFAGVNTFAGDVVMSSGLQFTTGAAAGYVMTSDASGNISLAPAAGDLVDSLQTLNATPTAITSIAVAASSVVQLKGSINAANAAYTDACGGEFDVTVRCGATGAPVIVGSAWVVVNASSTASFNAAIVGNNVVINVTGIAATTYNWTSTYLLSTLAV